MSKKVRKLIAMAIMSCIIVQGNLIQSTTVFANENKNPTVITDNTSNKVDINTEKKDDAYYKKEVQNLIDSICSDLIKTDKVKGWNILNVKKAGYDLPDNTLKELENHIISYINSDSTIKDFEREALHVLAAGGDPTNIGGINLIDKIYTTKTVDIYGYIYGLLALNAKEFKIPENAINTQTKFIKSIIDNFNEEFGWGDTWCLGDGNGMTFSALAPYYKKNPRVTECVDKALEILSKNQSSNGTIDDNSNSTAMLIIGLCDLGINPTKDERFVKNGNTLIDGLLNYKTTDSKGFGWKDKTYNGMATDQGLRALAAYKNLIEDNEGVYSFKNTSNKEDDKNQNNTEDKGKQVLTLENLSNVSEFKLGTDAKIKIKGTNNTDTQKEVTIIVGLFNEKNKLENHVSVTSKIDSKESKELSALLKLPKEGNYCVKVLSWDNLQDMNSISEEIVIPVK